MTSCCLRLIGINVSIILMLTGITLTVNIRESVFTTDMIKIQHIWKWIWKFTADRKPILTKLLFLKPC